MSQSNKTICSMLSSFICKHDQSSNISGLVRKSGNSQSKPVKQNSSEILSNKHFKKLSVGQQNHKNATSCNKNFHFASKNSSLETQSRNTNDFEKLSMKRYQKASLDSKWRYQKFSCSPTFEKKSRIIQHPQIYQYSKQFSKMQLTNVTENQQKPITNRSNLTIKQNNNNENQKYHYIEQKKSKGVSNCNGLQNLSPSNYIGIQEVFEVSQEPMQNDVEIMSFKPKSNYNVRSVNISRIAQYKNTKNRQANNKNLVQFEKNNGVGIIKLFKKVNYYR